MSSTTPITSANASPVTTRISQSSDGQSIIEPPNMTPTEPNTTPEDTNSTEQMINQMSKNMVMSNANHVITYIIKYFCPNNFITYNLCFKFRLQKVQNIK